MNQILLKQTQEQCLWKIADLFDSLHYESGHKNKYEIELLEKICNPSTKKYAELQQRYLKQQSNLDERILSFVHYVVESIDSLVKQIKQCFQMIETKIDHSAQMEYLYSLLEKSSNPTSIPIIDKLPQRREPIQLSHEIMEYTNLFSPCQAQINKVTKFNNRYVTGGWDGKLIFILDSQFQNRIQIQAFNSPVRFLHVVKGQYLIAVDDQKNFKLFNKSHEIIHQGQVEGHSFLIAMWSTEQNIIFLLEDGTFYKYNLIMTDYSIIHINESVIAGSECCIVIVNRIMDERGVFWECQLDEDLNIISKVKHAYFDSPISHSKVDSVVSVTDCYGNIWVGEQQFQGYGIYHQNNVRILIGENVQVNDFIIETQLERVEDVYVDKEILILVGCGEINIEIYDL